MSPHPRADEGIMDVEIDGKIVGRLYYIDTTRPLHQQMVPEHGDDEEVLWKMGTAVPTIVKR